MGPSRRHRLTFDEGLTPRFLAWVALTTVIFAVLTTLADAATGGWDTVQTSSIVFTIVVFPALLIGVQWGIHRLRRS